MQLKACACVTLCAATSVLANILPRQTDASSSTTESAPEITEVTSCHPHGSELYCMHGETEFLVDVTKSPFPESLTSCHPHGADLYCLTPDNEDVQVEGAGGDDGDDHDHDHDGDDHGHDHEDEEEGSGHCHYHAGVEHCPGQENSCDNPTRDYDIPLRVGLLFVILATSAIGVFGPIILYKFMPGSKVLSLVFVVVKQFGTGIIISTAFVHLYTHAALMFGSDCLGDLGYEATTSAVVMAGIFLSFLVEYIGQRIVLKKTRSMASMSVEERSKVWLSTEVVSILVMEMGIIFHSILIGLSLVVTGDSFFITFFIVILFHQMFEGVALGSRIATIGTVHDHSTHTPGPAPAYNPDADKSVDTADNSSSDNAPLTVPTGLSMKKKLSLATAFAFITPIGMAIGLGVINQFNGNDKSTLVAIGTLDAVSAGILVWVGVVEMLAGDWIVGMHGHKAELAEASLPIAGLGMFGLIAGLVLMSFIGKWA